MNPGVDEQFQREIRADERFKFGENWKRFLSVLSDERIADAEKSLKEALEVDGLEDKTFLDVGSGSGLFSLAARTLGSKVHSFDYDPASVWCTSELKRRYFKGDARWTIEQGSVLDEEYLSGLGAFDVVYAWGCLHHTGDMWKALENVDVCVKPEGKLFISIYNDQGRFSTWWRKTKKLYVHSSGFTRLFILSLVFSRFWLPPTLRDIAKAEPFRTWREYSGKRGMSPLHDISDWAGGYPFEVSKPEHIFHFYKARGYALSRLKTCGGGHGCNEYVFLKHSDSANGPSSLRLDRRVGQPAPQVPRGVETADAGIAE